MLDINYLAYNLAVKRSNIDMAVGIANKFKDIPKRHASVIFEKNNILSFGYNFYTHAEQDSILKLDKKKKNLNILVIRISTRSCENNLKFTSSKPCYLCIKKMEGIIKTVYYSDSDGKIVKKKLKELMQEEMYVCNKDRKARRTL